GQGRTESTQVYARKTKVKLEEIVAGARIRANPIDILGLSVMPIEVMLNGPNLDSLLALSERVRREMEMVNGCVEITASVEPGNPEVKVEVNRQRMADNGLAMAQVGLTLQTAFSGNTDAKFRAGDYEYPIRIGLDAFNRRRSPPYFTCVPAGSASASTLAFTSRPTVPSVKLSAQVIGRPKGTVGREVKARVDALALPAGTQVKYGGDLRLQQQGIGTMGFALWTSLLLVYLIMVALYDNWIYPLVVLVSIPLAVIGAFLALALAGENLTVFT
ncbi:MAG: efflux RND transporter permease subunit, partial [Bacteroidota bacterium]